MTDTPKPQPRKRTTSPKPAKRAAAAKKSPAKRAPARRTPAVRDAKVVLERGKGKSFEAIAKQLRMRDATAAHAAYERGLAKVLPPTPEEQRRDDLARIREAEDEQWPKAETGDLAAFAALVDLELERRHLLQGDVPIETTRVIGPIEAATAGECHRLTDVAPALAATALVLARVVDEHTDEPGHTATAARELRMHMSQLRGLAGTRPPQQQPHGDPDDGAAKQTGRVVVPKTKLDELRERARERSSS